MGGINSSIPLQAAPAPVATPLATPQQQLDTLSRLRQYQQQQQLAPLQAQELSNNVTLGQQAVQRGQED
jgi:hypothetical protein